MQSRAGLLGTAKLLSEVKAREHKDKEDGKMVERRSLDISRPNLQALMRERYSTTCFSCVREGKPCASKGMYLIVAQP